jgi:DNA-binding winged helix-turn-helix (wHTH) protein
VRRKLGAAPGEPGPIRTFQGIGYVLDTQGELTEAPRNTETASTTTA